MAGPRFYVGDAVALAAGETVELPEAVGHHAMRVVRLAVDDALTLFDGRGGEYAATITTIDRKAVHARIDAHHATERESALRITLAQVIVANDAMDYAVRKAVELGVAAIVPLTSARSAPLPPRERGDRRVAHWQQIAIAACEQCGRNRVPQVMAPIALADWCPAEGQAAYVAAPGASVALAAISKPSLDCAMIIGPEGGFTADEMTSLDARGARRVSMGPRVLRTETAAVTALSILQSRWGDLA